MDKKYKKRSLLEFQKTFSNDEACIDHLKEMRWPNGFICPKCQYTEAWYIRSRRIFDCKQCRTKTSITAGTIFHKTRTPLVKWYWFIYQMAMNKVGVSIAELQRILEIKDYKTAWLIAHKIRKAMADRDARYNLAGLIEMDDSFFGATGTIRGRGSENKSIVLCAVSLYKDSSGEDRPGFAHMRVVNDASAQTIEDFLERLGCGKTTEEGKQMLNAIRTDGWRSYGKAARQKDLDHCKIILRDPKAAGRLLPWIHRVISNAKSVIGGTHRGVSKKYLQSYLSEICYRFNRRFWEKELFDRLVKACVSTNTITFLELIAKQEIFMS